MEATVFKFKDPIGPANKASRVYFAVMSNVSRRAEVIELYIGEKFAVEQASKINGYVRKGIVFEDQFVELI
jgi:hypothetical protein